MQSKAITKFLLVITAIITLFSSCKKQEDATLAKAELSSDVTTFEVKKYDNTVAFNISWTPVSEATAYFVQFASNFDPEFLKAYIMKVEYETALEITYKDLKTIQETIGVTSDYQLIVRVLSEAPDYVSSYSNKVTMDVAMKIWPDLALVYLCGDGCPGSWNAGTVPSVHMTAQNGEMYDIYTWEGQLAAAPAGFRVNVQKDWFPSIMQRASDGKAVYLTNDDYYGAPDGTYLHFTVPEAGNYLVTFDFRDFNNPIITTTKK